MNQQKYPQWEPARYIGTIFGVPMYYCEDHAGRFFSGRSQQECETSRAYFHSAAGQSGLIGRIDSVEA